MDFNEYQALAFRTANKDLSDNEQLTCAAMGLSSEAGEFAGIIKKWRYQGHDLDRNKAIKELGDTLWYLSDAASALGITLEEIATINIEKLLKRFEGEFTPEKSIMRKDLI